MALAANKRGKKALTANALTANKKKSKKHKKR